MILDRDLKILWGKAAGRCAITRKRLVATASEAVPSKNILLGENCHIVGEKQRAARGKSTLTLAERNRYPNLILLCAEEHTRIDQDPSAWPVEKLHQIKADHELWVEERLAEGKDKQDQIYANLINRITEDLDLDGWMVRSDNMLRGIVSVDWIDCADEIIVVINRTVWPKKYPKLERAIRNLEIHLERYKECYMRHTYLHTDGRHYYEDKWYRSAGENSQAVVKIFTLWQGLHMKYLLNLTVAFNEFAEAVREEFKPDYFALSGKFCVSDQMGYTNQMVGITYFPNLYRDMKAEEVRYQRWMKFAEQDKFDRIWEEWEKIQVRKKVRT